MRLDHALQQTTMGGFSSAVAVHVASRRWLSFFVSHMRILAFCCMLVLLAGCDSLGGRTVILNLKPQQTQPPDNASVEQALSIVDKATAPDGITRSAVPSNGYGRVADYIGSHFICSAFVRDHQLTVHFLNSHFGGGPPDTEVAQVSDSVAEALRTEYGAKQVRIKN